MLKAATLPLALSLAFAFSAAAQTIKERPVTMTSAASGQQMFKEYCASCHGIDGRGSGPAAPALNKLPTDLTLLSRQNGGKYPELKVVAVIKGDNATMSHGSKDMPVWGQLFSETISHGSQSDVQLRIANLTAYIKSLQK